MPPINAKPDDEMGTRMNQETMRMTQGHGLEHLKPPMGCVIQEQTSH